MKKIRALVVGSINMDVVCKMRRVPSGGETVVADEYGFYPGGKGANQAVSLARQGASVSFVGRTGRDAFGAALKKKLAECGVGTTHLFDCDLPTGIANIWVDGDGQNRIAVCPGANSGLTCEDVSRALDGDAFDLCLAQLEIPDETVIAASAAAAKKGVKFALDAGPARAFPLEKLSSVFLLSPNETETRALCGIFPEDEKSAAQAAARLKEICKCEIVAIKLGEKGAFVHARGFSKMVGGYGIDAVDTTAAGDAFTAALSLRLLQGENLLEATRYANAAGALTATRRGAQPSLPTGLEIEAFIKKHPAN